MTERDQAEMIQSRMLSIRNRVSRPSVSLQLYSNQFQLWRKRIVQRALVWAAGTAVLGVVGIAGVKVLSQQWRKSQSASLSRGGLSSTKNQALSRGSGSDRSVVLSPHWTSGLRRWLTVRTTQSLGAWLVRAVVRHATAYLDGRKDQHDSSAR